MKFQELIKFSRSAPVIQTKMLYTYEKNEKILYSTISRLVKSGKLIKLRRGYYLIAEEYRLKDYNREFLSTHIYYPSYISLEYALYYYNLIPESVYPITLLTTRAPLNLKTEIGDFIYRHIHTTYFFGYKNIKSEENGENFFVATPEKAILDLFYFKSGKITLPYLEEMRFENYESIDFKKLDEFAKLYGSKKITEGAKLLRDFFKKGVYKIL